jgi:hypothetical protein
MKAPLRPMKRFIRNEEMQAFKEQDFFFGLVLCKF